MARVPNPLPYVRRPWDWFFHLEAGLRWMLVFFCIATFAFILTMLGLAFLGAILFVVSFITLMTMAFTPPPRTSSPEEDTGETPDGDVVDDESKDDGSSEGIEGKVAEAPPAPTSKTTRTFEAPSMDILDEGTVKVEDEEVAASGSEADEDEEDGEIWV